MPDRVPLEVEAKLAIDDIAKVRDVLRATAIAGYRVRALGAARLRTLYLDTPRFSLTRNGLAFRVRRHGRRWQATLKWSGQVRDGVHERPELNVDLAKPPKFPFVPTAPEIHTHLAAMLAGRGASPILETNILRRRFELWREDTSQGVVVAELDLDEVALVDPKSGRAVESYAEVEVECRDGGTTGDIATISEWCQRELRGTPETETKFSRGLARLYPKVKLRSDGVRYHADDRLEVVVRRFVARQLGALRAADVVARGGNDPEGVHQMRVALRRVRTAVKSFRESVPALRLRAIEAELEWLAGVLAPVRELDVVLARVDACEDEVARSFGFVLDGLKAALRERRRQYDGMLKELLESRRYFRLLLSLERLSDGAGSGKRGSRFGAAAYEAVARSAKRARKRGKQAIASKDVVAIHALRLAIKRLRYVIELSSSLSERRAAKVVRDLVKLQRLLGTYHDAIMSIEAARRDGMSNAGELVLGAGAFVGFEAGIAAQCVRELGRVWRKFDGGESRRHLRALLDELSAYAEEPQQPVSAK